MNNLREKLYELVHALHDEGRHNEAEFIGFLADRIGTVNFTSSNYGLSAAFRRLVGEDICGCDYCSECGKLRD